MDKKELKAAVDQVLALEGKEQTAAIETLITDKANADLLAASTKEAHDKAIADLTSEKEELQAQLDSAKDNPGELKRCQKTFKVGGKDYRFKVGYLKFRFQGRVVEAEEVAGDKDMREELVKIKFGGIEEVPSK